jgi:hypothetical protein
MKSLLLLPGDPEFDRILSTPPPDWQQVANKDGNTYTFLADANSGVLRAATARECEDYLLGGEYDERLTALYDPDEDGLYHDDLEGVEEVYIDWD